MIKFVALTWRHPRLTRHQFIERYENGHIPLVCDLIPHFSDYRRNYMMPGGSLYSHPALTGFLRPDFDTISEFRMEDEWRYEAVRTALAEPERGEIIQRDEAEAFDTAKFRLYRIEEFSTPVAQLAPRPAAPPGKPDMETLDPRGMRFNRPLPFQIEPPVKATILARRKDGVVRAEAIRRCEEEHVPSLLKLKGAGGLPLIAQYQRNYVIDDAPNVVPHVPDGEGRAFDVMQSLWFWREADLAAFVEQAFGQSKTLFLDDVEAFLNPLSILAGRIDERITGKERLARTASHWQAVSESASATRMAGTQQERET